MILMQQLVGCDAFGLKLLLSRVAQLDCGLKEIVGSACAQVVL